MMLLLSLQLLDRQQLYLHYRCWFTISVTIELLKAKNKIVIFSLSRIQANTKWWGIVTLSMRQVNVALENNEGFERLAEVLKWKMWAIDSSVLLVVPNQEECFLRSQSGADQEVLKRGEGEGEGRSIWVTMADRRKKIKFQMV